MTLLSGKAIIFPAVAPEEYAHTEQHQRNGSSIVDRQKYGPGCLGKKSPDQIAVQQLVDEQSICTDYIRPQNKSADTNECRTERQFVAVP